MSLNHLIGYILYYSFARYLPRSSSRINVGQTYLRSICGKLIFDYCGKNVNIERRAYFSHSIHLGDNSGIGINATIHGEVFIGNDVMMGPNCTIYTVNHKHDDTDRPMRVQGFESMRPVFIGDDVWIGGNVTILPGVNIGKGSIIGACTVVTKDVPPYSIVCGNPGKVVKNRLEK